MPSLTPPLPETLRSIALSPPLRKENDAAYGTGQGSYLRHRLKWGGVGDKSREGGMEKETQLGEGRVPRAPAGMGVLIANTSTAERTQRPVLDTG